MIIKKMYIALYYNIGLIEKPLLRNVTTVNNFDLATLPISAPKNLQVFYDSVRKFKLRLKINITSLNLRLNIKMKNGFNINIFQPFFRKRINKIKK